MAKTNTPTAWVGWGYFAAFMLMLIGIMQVVQGLGALLNPDYFVTTATGVFVLSLTTWGWVHLLIGVVALAAGVGLMSGATWARIVAMLATVIAALGSIAYITTFPIWATFILVVCGLVMYALTIHGGEMKKA